MAKDFSKKFYNSKEWQAARSAYIAERIGIDGGLCERCHKELGKIVHHKVTLNAVNINDADVTLNKCRLEYLCKECHDEEHYKDMFGRERKPSRCFFDERGNPVIKNE